MKNECGMLNAECGARRLNPSLNAASPRAAFSIHHSAFSSPPRGFTLIELLVTMVIIAIISAAILGTAAAAMESARRTRTQSLITKISGLVLERWDSYGNRRVDVAPSIRNTIDLKFQNGDINAVERGQMLADARLLALRELMKMEMPDRWSDIIGVSVGQTPAGPLVLQSPGPAITQTYLRRYQQAFANPDVDADTLQLHQGAECLYMTVMFATGDGEARTLFSAQDIGDVDGDGAPEFLDGWGNPISWLRWPAGFVSDLQALSPDGSRPVETDHDPFDIYRRDVEAVSTPNEGDYPPVIQPQVGAMRASVGAYRLVPLIYSSGPDELSDISSDPSFVTETDPYAETGSNLVLLGTAYDVNEDGDENFRDNISNHLNEY